MSLAGSDCARRWAGAKDLTFAIGSFGSEEGTLAWIKKRPVDTGSECLFKPRHVIRHSNNGVRDNFRQGTVARANRGGRQEFQNHP